jgi:hypothetical protein
VNLSKKEAEEVSEILSRRANEIAIYKTDMMKEKHHLGSVELALTREMERLRSLAEKVNPMILED